jgi:hypothetical protein
VRQVFQLNPNGWTFAAGHVPKLELLPDDSPYGRASPGQKPVTVSNLELRLPVLETPGALGGLVQAPAEKVLPAGYQLARGFDLGPPETRIDHPRSATNDTTPELEFSSSDVGSTFECRLDSTDDADWASCSSPFQAPELAEGEHTFDVRATDPEDNTDATPASLSFDVDTVAPPTEIGKGPKGTVKRGHPVAFRFESAEAGSTFECKLDDRDFVPCDSPKRYSTPFLGRHLFQVRAVDAAGNVDSTPAKKRFRLVK